MKDRLITLLFALAAFLLSVFLLMPPPQTTEPPLSIPTTEDKGAAGLKGLYHWLKNNNIAVHSLRERYTELNFSTGNVLILSMPQHTGALHTEWLALRKWIERGNSVFVLGAGYFEPDWANEEDCFCGINKFLQGLGLKIVSNEEEIEEVENENGEDEEEESEQKTFTEQIDEFKQNLKTFAPEELQLEPLSKHSLMQQVTAIQGNITPSLVDHRWTIETENNLVLKLLATSQYDNLTLAWQMEAGEGQVFLSLIPNIFSNEMLNKADNARFLSNMLSLSLQGKGKVIFDDYHFGISNLYDSDKFFDDPRLHKTIGFLALLWILYVVGYSNRLAPVNKVAKKPSVLDFVEATAGFFSRHLDKKTVAQTLTRQLIQDVRTRRQFHNDQAAWQWLNQHPGIQASQLDFLQQADQKKRISLQQLTDTITAIRKTIFL